MRTHAAVVAAGAVLVLGLGLSGCAGSNESPTNTTAGSATAQKASDGAVPAPAHGAGSAATAGTTAGSATTTGGTGAASGSASTPTLTAADVQPAYRIRTADIDLTAADPLAAKARIEGIATGAGGFVFSDDSTTAGHDTAVHLTLKVPPDAYDDVVRRISAVGTLQHIQQSTQDVTSQVVDVQSRLAVQRSSIARLRALLDNAGDLGKIIQIESELTKREADLESMEAQLKALTAKTELATISASVTPPAKRHQVQPAGAVTVADGFGGGAQAFVTFFRWLGIALGAALPFAAAAAVITLAVVVVRRRLRPSAANDG